MADFRFVIKIVILFVVFTIFPSNVKGIVEFIPPLPGHQVVIEGETTNVTCIAFDYANETIPDEIVIEKIINRFGDREPIKDGGRNGNYTFVRDPVTGVKDGKLSKTLVINKMIETMKDGYVCTVFFNTSQGRRSTSYGFGMSYIPKADLPSIAVSNNVKTEFGKSAALSCNLTKASHQSNLVKLDRIAWFKNDQLRDEVLHLEDERLKEIQLPMENPEDAGVYTCRLFTTLQGIRKYTMEGAITVEIVPKFMTEELDDNEIIRKKGESAKFSCDAKGNPIKITWKKKPKSGDEMIINSTASMMNDSDSHYKFSYDENRLQGFWLEIPKTEYSDRGDYKCCFADNSNKSQENCQTFTLRVKDPLGYLWPLIGIIIQAILIVIILLVSAKLKSNSLSASDSKIVKQTDLSYSRTDKGTKGHIRLRNTGARSS